jgi:hypothetical protein
VYLIRIRFFLPQMKNATRFQMARLCASKGTDFLVADDAAGSAGNGICFVVTWGELVQPLVAVGACSFRQQYQSSGIANRETVEMLAFLLGVCSSLSPYWR